MIIFLFSWLIEGNNIHKSKYNVPWRTGILQMCSAVGAKLVPYKHFTVTGAYLLLPRAGNGALGGEWEEFPLTLRKLPFTCWSIIDVQMDDIRGRPVIEVLR